MMITLDHNHLSRLHKVCCYHSHNIINKFYHFVLYSPIRQQLCKYNKYVVHHQHYFYHHNVRTNKTVAIAMSGGIDSSAAAMILKDKGYNCIGVYMKNWDLRDEYDYDSNDSNNVNCSSSSSSRSSSRKKSCEYYDDIRDMRQVCERLEIPAIEVIVCLKLIIIGK